MNSIYRSIWNDKTSTFVAAPENAKSHGKKSSPGASAVAGGALFALKGLAASLMLAFGAQVYALPTGGAVSAGSASIASSAGGMTISQASQNVAINWQSFNIGQNEAVRFVQPNSSSVALNRVLGSDPSSILGSLSANGKVFLLNPNGMLFGKGASVNVGGLVASTLNIADGDFMAGAYKFAGAGNGAILNQGSINADGGYGYVALLGANISNQGVISARLGSVALVAGDAMTLDIGGDGLLNVAVNQGAVNALVQNGGMIRADGGQVLLTTQAAGNLLQSVVNNTGVIRAQTIENRNGTIKLLGDMQSGTANVGGTLDASAPQGGDGGFIETSAAHVNVADATIVTRLSAQGRSGTWLIDPSDYTIAATGGNISGTTLGSNLAGGPITILSSSGTIGGSGDINVNAAVSWTANLLTLTAARDININAVMTASNTASLAMNANTANGADGAVAGGAVRVGMNADGFTGKVNFFQADGVTPRSGTGFLNINTLPITVITSLGAEGSVTGTDLQGIIKDAGSLAVNYALGANIDASATGTTWAGAGFLPIGVFTGSFNGLGHTITGLTINRPVTANVGLFGSVGAGASKIIRNVGLVGGSITGAAGTGGLIGDSGAGGTVSNSYNTGTVSGAAGTGGLIGSNGAGNAVDYSYATGNVTGAAGAAGVGGLLGSNGGGSLVTNSYATGSVTTSAGAASVGGLIGTNGALSSISKSFATGSVSNTGAGAAGVGGLVGSNTTATVTDSYATGSVTNSGAGAAGTGGLMGSNTSGAVNNTYAAGSVTAAGASIGGLLGSSNAAVVVHSYWDTTTTGQGASAGGGFGMTTAQMKTQLNFTSSTAANTNSAPTWNFTTTWFMYEGITYPLLRPFMTPLTVTANSVSTTYNGAAQTGGSGVTYSPSSYNGTYVLGTVSTSGGGTAVGSYAITPSGLYSNQKGYIISYANGTLGIAPAALGVAANAAAKTYDGLAFSGGNGVTYSGFQGSDTAASLSGTLAYGGTSQGAVNVGSYTIIPSGQSSTNYAISYVNGTLGVIAGGLGIVANAAAKIYDGLAYSGGNGVTYTGFQGTDTAASLSGALVYGGSSQGAVNVGNYAIVPSGQTSSNYTITYVNSTLGVIPTPLGIAANSATRQYGTANPAFSATYAGFRNGETPAALTGALVTTTPAVATSNVGNYAIIPSGQSSTNYTINYVNGVLGVLPAPLWIAANSATRQYGAANPAFSATYAGFRNGETPAALTGTLATTTPAVATSKVGNYTITPSGQSSTNYTITYINGTLTVTPVGLTVTASNALKTYGQTPTLTAFTTAGLLNGETVGSVTETSAGTAADAGVTGNPYAITPSNATGGTFTASNYTIAYVNGVLTVMPLVQPVPLVALPVTQPVVEASWMPAIVLADTPAQLLTVVTAETPGVVPVAVPPATPIVVPEPMPPKLYVPPQRPRKQDRN